ncbi:hypothetical protein FB446DRAFT_830300 [Lentinula raphanica]|nr:hypothetical protein FB446DRAFT_830300 [Lentinula raphanica]
MNLENFGQVEVASIEDNTSNEARNNIDFHPGVCFIRLRLYMCVNTVLEACVFRERIEEEEMKEAQNFEEFEQASGDYENMVTDVILSNESALSETYDQEAHYDSACGTENSSHGPHFSNARRSNQLSLLRHFIETFGAYGREIVINSIHRKRKLTVGPVRDNMYFSDISQLGYVTTNGSQSLTSLNTFKTLALLSKQFNEYELPVDANIHKPFKSLETRIIYIVEDDITYTSPFSLELPCRLFRWKVC